MVHPETRSPSSAWEACLPRRCDIPHRARLVDYDIMELAALLREKSITAVALTQAYLDRIDEFNGTFETYDENGGYNAFIRIDREEALAQARDVDDRLQRGETLPLLAGIPLGFKDTIAIRGRQSTNGWAGFQGNIAPEDAAIVALLREEHAVLLGHTTCSELSGSITGTFAGNAWDPRYVPGGSSQGSGVAPAARLAAAAIGVETGGSIIIPAAANGCSAIKPSSGLLSERGIMQNSPGLDTPGPMARSIRDASLLLNVMTRFDRGNNPSPPGSPLPLPAWPLTPQSGDKPLQNIRIGLPQKDWMSAGTGAPPATTYDTAYLSAYHRFIGQLTSLGAEVVEFDGLDLLSPENDPFTYGPVIEEIDGYPVGAILACTATRTLNLRKMEALDAFISTCEGEQRDKLEQHYRLLIDLYKNHYSKMQFSTIATGERRRRQLRTHYQKALDDNNIDFMMVLPLGAHIPRRFPGPGKPGPYNFSNMRNHYGAPNNLGWPVVTFPVGISTFSPVDTSIDDDTRLPITAAFWGPRFSEPLLIQAAIDFQSHFPEYHNAVPPDPVFGPDTRRPVHHPCVEPVTPDNTTDPAMMAARGLSSWPKRS